MMNNPVKIDPNIMGGVPCFTGTRVPVKTLFDYIERNYPLEEFFEDFPSVSRDHVISVLQLAHHKILQEASTVEAIVE